MTTPESLAVHHAVRLKGGHGSAVAVRSRLPAPIVGESLLLFRHLAGLRPVRCAAVQLEIAAADRERTSFCKSLCDGCAGARQNPRKCGPRHAHMLRSRFLVQLLVVDKPDGFPLLILEGHNLKLAEWYRPRFEKSH